MNLLAHIDSRPWAILPTELNRMRAAITAEGPNAYEKIAAAFNAEQSVRADLPAGSMRYGKVEDSGTAIINISGPLFNVEGFIDEIIAFYFGGTSIQQLSADVTAATNNPAVTSVVFKCSSPGGEVFGINETAEKIAKLTAKKPTIAFAYGYCASACYFLAAKCGEIVPDANSILGSIGVVATWADFTEFYAMQGIAYEEVTSDGAPNKRPDIRKPEQREVFMKWMNGLENTFQKSVAKGRGVSIDVVRSQFGQGAIMDGPAAVKAGLADRLGSLESVIKDLQLKTKQKSGVRADAEGEIEMSEKSTLWEQVKAVFASNGVEMPEAGAASVVAAKVDNSETLQLRADKAAAETKLAEIEAQRETDFTAQVQIDAKAFVEAECKDGRMFPAEKESMSALYAQAAADDRKMPIEGVSRLDTLKAQQAKRMPHGLTAEALEGAETLPLGGDKPSAERKAELLATSALGKSALKLAASNGKNTAA